MSNRQRAIVVIGLLISAVFLVLAFQGLKPDEVLASISSASLPLVIAGAVWYLASRIVIALRWGFLLRSTRAVPVRSLLELVCIGYMGNNVYPLRAGELLRIFLLRREHAVPVVRTTTIIVAERVFDGVVLLSFVILGVLVLDVGTPEVRAIISLAAPLFALALIVFFALALNQTLFRRLLAGVCDRLPAGIGGRLRGLGEHVIDGLGGLRTPGDLAGTIVTSYGTWLLEAVTYLLVAQAMGLSLDYLAMLLLVGVINLAGLIPASPGQFGVFEGFARITLVGLGVGVTEATAYALVVHLVLWLPVTVIGFVLLARRGLFGMRAVAQAGQTLREEERTA
jgi:uncharacterized membrane protein YbhN (UPF0104 family)